MAPASGEITQILQRWDTDRESAIQALTPIVYAELRKIAAAYLRRQRTNHTLQPTALVHEAYMRLVKQNQANLKDRYHFYTLAARMMRQILVDAARARNAEKRAATQVTLDDQVGFSGGKNALELMVIHQALDNLHQHNPRLAEAVELRYFGGLPLDEIADALAISLATVKRDLSLGVAWLRRALAHA